MALFRIFRRRNGFVSNSKEEERKRAKCCWNLNKEDLSESSRCTLPDLRFVTFRENEWKERRLLFDSDAATVSVQQQLQTPNKTSPVNKNSMRTSFTWDLSPNGNGSSPPSTLDDEPFTATRVKSDTKLLGEMIFGSVTMSFKGDTMKLHEFKSPQKLMLTRVFNMPPIRRKSCRPAIYENGVYDNCASPSTNDSDTDSQYSTVNSLENYLNGDNNNRRFSRSTPLDVPTNLNRTTSTTQTQTPSPEGSDMTRSSSKDFNNGTPITPVASSWKRYQLNQFMNLQSGIQRRSSQNMEDEDNISNFVVRKRMQLGIAVIISLVDDNDDKCLSPGGSCFRKFFFSHMQIIESEFLNLQKEILRACHSGRQFSSCVLHAWKQFRTSLKILFETFRLRTPVWLGLMSDTRDDQRKLESNFLSALVGLSDVCDRKETKFFLSSLLTAFLSNHSSWVSSVAPSTSTALDSKTTSSGRIAQWGRNTEAGCHPSNPFFAQLLDVWGVINSGRHSIRTVIVDNRDGELSMQILFVLSYFLRCSSLTIKCPFDQLVRLPNLLCSTSDERSIVDVDDDSDYDSTDCSTKVKFTLDDVEEAMDVDDESTSCQRFFHGVSVESLVRPAVAVAKRVSDGGGGSTKLTCLGASLQASVVQSFQPHFALSAMSTTGQVDAHVRESLKKAAGVDSSVPAVDCLIADTRDWVIKLISCDAVTLNCTEKECVPAPMVLELIDNVKTLSSTNCDADFIFMFIEDWLTDIYAKGVALASLLDDGETQNLNYLATLLGSDVNDMPLLYSICSC